MSFYKEQNTRIRLKRTATSGATPSVGPTPDHTDGSWGINDIYGGEFFWNMYDQALWLGWNTGTTSGVTLIYSGGTGGGGGGTYTADNGLTENPANNFQLGGPLTQYTQIDGASGTHSLDIIDMLSASIQTQDYLRLDAQGAGSLLGRFQIDTTSILTDWTFADGAGNTTAIEMNGLEMFVKAPGWNTGSNGDYFRLKDPATGECDWYPLPGSSSSYCITDFYVTNVHGCSPINMKDEVICESGLTATTISATTYLNLPSSTFTGGTITGPTNFTGGLTANTISATTYDNLPVSAITAGSNIVVSNNDGNVTISQNNGGTNVLWKDVTLYTSNVAANTIIASKLIPANTFQVGDFYEYTINFSGNVTNTNSVTRRVYINTSASLVGAQQLAIFTNTVGTNQYTALYRHGFVLSTGTTGSFNSYGQATAISSILFNNSATQIFTINTTIDQYIIVATQVPTTAFTDGFRGINFRITR
jgi:hypothetical protein